MSMLLTKVNNAKKKCPADATYEATIQGILQEIDARLKDYTVATTRLKETDPTNVKKNINGSGADTSSSEITDQSDGKDAIVGNFRIKGKNWKSVLLKNRYYRHERQEGYEKDKKPYLPGDIPVLLMYGFIKREN
jgi:hypothetical protein